MKTLSFHTWDVHFLFNHCLPKLSPKCTFTRAIPFTETNQKWIGPKFLEGHPHKVFKAWPTLHGWQVSGVTNNLNIHYVKNLSSLCLNGCVIFRRLDATFREKYIFQDRSIKILTTCWILHVIFLFYFWWDSWLLLSFCTSFNNLYWKSDSPCYWLCRKVDIQMKRFALHRIPSFQRSVQQWYKIAQLHGKRPWLTLHKYQLVRNKFVFRLNVDLLLHHRRYFQHAPFPLTDQPLTDSLHVQCFCFALISNHVS